MKLAKRQRQAGFTIIELMIATTVLSVMLVLVTFMMINIGKLYYKGMSQAKAQQTARSIVSDVASHLELNDQDPTTATGTSGEASAAGLTFQAYCIGETRYTYVLDRQIGTDPTQIRHVLWRDKTPDDGCSHAFPDLALATPSPGGTELMTDRGRLAAFSVGLSSPHEIQILVALGEDGLFIDTGINTLCSNQAGNEFCATSRLTTSVTKRLSGS